MTDRIVLSNMMFRARHGVHPQEQLNKQAFGVDRHVDAVRGDHRDPDGLTQPTWIRYIPELAVGLDDVDIAEAVWPAVEEYSGLLLVPNLGGDPESWKATLGAFGENVISKID